MRRIHLGRVQVTFLEICHGTVSMAWMTLWYNQADGFQSFETDLSED
jgi:hypothetical protein